MNTNAAIKTDTAVEIVLYSGQLIVKPLPEPEITLADLLAGIAKDNLHYEIDMSAPVGNVIW
ncbi:MAG: AbrB/MazE/SpoVT family DNA-binding domain-containing protein [Anaerolineae bacterium]|nr:AbrB/MazE/SpoVT family DNA-binding domain-containing protein [Anaerolineae bacterium]MCO5195409.1 AbrB/MazE/SpoVT family DNA-binding domain-containing protein [Anaerolineae bacterium]